MSALRVPTPGEYARMSWSQRTAAWARVWEHRWEQFELNAPDPLDDSEAACAWRRRLLMSGEYDHLPAGWDQSLAGVAS